MEYLQMQTIQKILIITGLSLLPFAASAQSVSDLQNMDPEERRAFMKSMSDDERTAMRDKWRSEFDGMSDEDKQAMRKRRDANRGDGGRDRAAMRERWETMSEEERAQAKDRRKAKGEKRRERWDSMSDEERAAARDKRGQQKGQRGERRQQGERGQKPQS